MSPRESKIVAADPDVAGALLAKHLDALWATGDPERRGWRRFRLDLTCWIVVMPAVDVDGRATHFFVRLDGRRYDRWPPEVQFVEPDAWEPVSSGRWWPACDPYADPDRSRWFGLHPRYDFRDGDPRPLVCFAESLGYYESRDAAGLELRWRQGRQTVAETLDRLAEILSPPYFEGPSA